MEKPSRSAAEPLPDTLMASVPKDFLFEGMALPVTIYVKMSENSYLVIGKKGDKATFSNMRSFGNDNFHIFVKAYEHAFLINYVTELTSKVLSQKSAPPAVKSKFMSGLIADAVSGFGGKNFTSAAQLERVSQFLIDICQKSESFGEMIKMLEELAPTDSKHSMATCLIALSICEEMNLTHSVAQEKVAMACLLHDVGLRMIPKEVLEKPAHLRTAEETAIYEQHPIKSVEILKHVKDLSNDVLIMIVEHHENSVGTGYPKRIRDVKLSPLGKVLILANTFTELLFPSSSGERVYKADEALQYIEDILGQPFNKGVFSALKNIVNKKYLADLRNKAS